MILTRDEFRESVFERDGHKCVICGNTAQDAHHIIERRLWSDGGYYLNNGASLCGECHLKAEGTVITVEEILEKAGIKKRIIPDHLYDDQIYDKWGNIILPNGSKLKGELFFDESVQKILNKYDQLKYFTDYVKYPRTHHLPWSLGINDDDRVLKNMDVFENKRVIITEKMDGENTTMYSDYIHARSIDSPNHPSRNWVKNYWSRFAHEIPTGWRICGENLYATHSIKYNDLQTFFYGFSIWDYKNVCLDWDSTLEWFALLNIYPVHVLYDDIYNESKIKKLFNEKLAWDRHEGYVLRLAEPITYNDFKFKVGKFVRKDHINTVKHWMHGQKMEQNTIAGMNGISIHPYLGE